MELKNKLKELRTQSGMTQEAVADSLGVSSQTVSKWERGLLSPDISLLPKIAMLFKCSIDSLFNMEMAWSLEHRNEFRAKILELHEQKDWEGVYQAWIREIELNPDYYSNYADVMLHVYRKKLYDKGRVKKMISLADHVEKCCTNDDIRNEVYRIMLQICFESDDPSIKDKGKYYYQKLPRLRHSREVWSSFVMEGDEHRKQLRKNIIYLINLVEACVRQLIVPEMSPQEKLFYYQKATALLETILDGKYAGFYDPPLLCNYCEIATIYMQLGETDLATAYIDRIVEAVEKHMSPLEKKKMSELLYSTEVPNSTPTQQICEKLFRAMLNREELSPFLERIRDLQKRYEAYNDKKEN